MDTLNTLICRNYQISNSLLTLPVSLGRNCAYAVSIVSLESWNSGLSCLGAQREPGMALNSEHYRGSLKARSTLAIHVERSVNVLSSW